MPEVQGSVKQATLSDIVAEVKSKALDLGVGLRAAVCMEPAVPPKSGLEARPEEVNRISSLHSDLRVVAEILDGCMAFVRTEISQRL